MPEDKTKPSKPPKPIVASYVSTFLKPEMLHIYRQITALSEFDTFVIAKERRSEKKYPFADLEMAPQLKSNFIRRAWLKYVMKKSAIHYRGEYGALNRILRGRKTDLMHVYFGHTGVHLLPFIKEWDKPTVVSFHGMDVQSRLEEKGYEPRLRELLQTVPLVMARSQSLQERLLDLGCPPEKIRLNRTGIPMKKFPLVERSYPEDGKWKLVQACRLVEKKGLDCSLYAFAQLKKKHPEANFTIAGEGPLLEQTKQQAAELGVADSVHFVGFLSEADLFANYADSHIFLHPSRITADQNQEGVPNSMLEAMATGLPILATTHGGIPEAVVHGKTGILVGEDDREALADALLNLCADKTRWSEMGSAAAADVRENFESSAQIAKLEGYYREVL